MVRVVSEFGHPFVEINGEKIAPAAFRSFRPQPYNVAQAARMGVRLYQMLVSGRRNALKDLYSLYGPVWVGDHSYDFTAFDRQMQMFRKYAPDGYFCIMIQLDTPEWWLEQHPECADSFHKMGQALTNEAWKRDAAEYLQAMIAYAEKTYGDRIFGYSFSCGLCTEWFSDDQGAATPEKEARYREYCGDPEIRIPVLTERQDGEVSDLRQPCSNVRRYMDFCCELSGDLVNFFAEKAQEVLKHEKLIGVFYGYLDQGTAVKQNLWMTNFYEKVWQNEKIDMLFSPASYNDNRYVDGVPLYQYAIDSLPLNKKLYIHEIDHRTDLAFYPLSTGKFMWDCYETAEESIAVLRRELCNAMLKNGGFWWFDFYGGYFSTPEYESELKHQVEIYNRLSRMPAEQVAEVAVFVDPKAMNLMKERVELVPECVRCNLTELVKSGAMLQTYNLSDLPRVDCSKYKMLVFVNALRMDDEMHAYIKEKLADKLVCYVYAPGIAAGEELDPTRISAVTGMNVVPMETDGKALNAEWNGQTFGFSTPVSPMFRVEDAGAEVWSRYENGAVCVARKGNVVYSAVGNVPFSVWQKAECAAGVHLYSEIGCYVAVNSRFAAMQNAKSEHCEIHLPFDCEVEELFEGGVYRTENGVLSYDAPKGSTRLFEIRKG